MKTTCDKPLKLGELVQAAFEYASWRTPDPAQRARVATELIARFLKRTRQEHVAQLLSEAGV